MACSIASMRLHLLERGEDLKFLEAIDWHLDFLELIVSFAKHLVDCDQVFCVTLQACLGRQNSRSDPPWDALVF